MFKIVLNQIQAARNPFIDIPLRSLNNITYDEGTGLLSLGNKTSKRVFFNVAHARKFMQTMVVASF